MLSVFYRRLFWRHGSFSVSILMDWLGLAGLPVDYGWGMDVQSRGIGERVFLDWTRRYLLQYDQRRWGSNCTDSSKLQRRRGRGAHCIRRRRLALIRINNNNYLFESYFWYTHVSILFLSNLRWIQNTLAPFREAHPVAQVEVALFRREAFFL